MKKFAATLGVVFALAACASEQAQPPAHVDRTLPPKIALNVQAINLADRSGTQPASSPYNSNRFTPTIAEAVKQWASDRLQASGASGQAIIVIKDASLIAQPLPIKQGMDGWFTRQQGSKYIARADVSIEATGVNGFATTDAVATRSVTLPEDPNPIEKQDAYYSLLNGLMKDLGQNLESGIQAHMGGFVANNPIYGLTAAPVGGAVTALSPDNGDFAPVIIQSPSVPAAAPVAPVASQIAPVLQPVPATLNAQQASGFPMAPVLVPAAGGPAPLAPMGAGNAFPLAPAGMVAAKDSSFPMAPPQAPAQAQAQQSAQTLPQMPGGANMSIADLAAARASSAASSLPNAVIPLSGPTSNAVIPPSPAAPALQQPAPGFQPMAIPAAVNDMTTISVAH